MHTKCIHNAYTMHTKCIQNAYTTHTKCIRISYEMHTKCIQNAYEMHTKRMQNAYKIHAKCIHNVRTVCAMCISPSARAGRRQLALMPHMLERLSVSRALSAARQSPQSVLNGVMRKVIGDLDVVSRRCAWVAGAAQPSEGCCRVCIWTELQ